MFKTKYRIVTDNYLGFEVQHKYWFWPFWIQTNFCNTHTSVKEAEEWIHAYNRNYVVKYL